MVISQQPKKRVAFVLIDGLGDVSIPKFGFKTPLQVAKVPNLDAIASAGVNGLMDPVEVGLGCGSDTAHLSLLGYDPRVYYRGRGAFESMGAGLAMSPGDIAFKSNFATLDEKTGIVSSRRADRHFEEEGPILCAALDRMKIPSFPEYEVRVRYATEHRCGVVVKGPNLSGNISGTDPLKDNRLLLQAEALDDSEEAKLTAAVVNELSKEISRILVSHPINAKRAAEGKNIANLVLLRGCGIRIEVPPFEKKHGLWPCMVAPTKIIAGLGLSLGIDILDAPGATGDYRTRLTSKATAIAKGLSAPLHSCPNVFVPGEDELKPGRADGYDFGFLHVKAIDDAGHDKATIFKVKGMEAVDRAIGQLAKLLWKAECSGNFQYYLCVTGDHSTPVEYGDHSFEPVPFTMCRLKDLVGAVGGESVIDGISLDPFPLPTVVPGEDLEWRESHKMEEERNQECQAFGGDSVCEFDEISAAKGCLGRFPGGEMMAPNFIHRGDLNLPSLFTHIRVQIWKMAATFLTVGSLTSSSINNVGEQLPGCLSLKRVPTHLRFSNGYRTKSASNPNLKAVEIPRQWYNLVADLPVKPPPPLHPKTYEPIKPEDLSHLFPDELIKQEASTERYINIPDEVVDIYGLWRPTPLIRAKRLEKLLDTPARIYYKYEGVSPAGSHKPNSAVPQVWYNAQEGVKNVVTETGAGQWGCSLAFACSIFGIGCEVWQVRASYDQKPYRRMMMETWGAKVHPSPSDVTDAGRKFLQVDPSSPGSLGIAISEAVEVAALNADTKYCLGSVLNHVLLHQTVIGEECLKQLEALGESPDLIIGCTGGGSNFAGLSFPFLREKLAGNINPVIRAVEPAACPSLTKGVYAYDYGDTAGMTPLMKMHTLGHNFIPDPIHAGGLRYHGMAPLISHVYNLGLLEAVSLPQTECFQGAIKFARSEGLIPAPEPTHAIAATIREALRCRETGESKVILTAMCGHGHFDLPAYEKYLQGGITDLSFANEKMKESLTTIPQVA